MFLSLNCISQELIIKKDSVKILAKVYAITPTEIRYSEFNDSKHNEYRIAKQLVSKIIFRNGTEMIFNSDRRMIQDTTLVLNIKRKRKIRDTLKLGDYIKFNIQAGAVVYNSFSNVPRKNYSGMTSSDTYRQVSSKQNVMINLGFNFIFGKSPYVKHIIGVNYLKTKSDYLYDYSGIGSSISARNKSNVDFINVVTGLRFSLFKKLHLEPLLIINFVAKSKTTSSGTKTNFDQYTYATHTTSFENEPIYTLVGTTVSLMPKISYELPVKKIKIEIYAAYNIALQYRLPWYQFGLHIFPFKKLR